MKCVLILGLVAAMVYMAGGQTAAAEPSAEAAAEESDFDVFDWISANPAYVAMIGMGVMIVLLTITVIVILCCYGGRDRDRSGGYVKN